MKKIIISLMAALFFIPAVYCAKDKNIPKNWNTDIELSLSQARKEEKLVLLLFSGSDWCPPCKMLKETVLDKSEFAGFAKRNFISVYFDFPRSRQIPQQQMAIQQQWMNKLKITGFPTTVILNGDGKVLKSIFGFPGAKKYMDTLKEFVESVK